MKKYSFLTDEENEFLSLLSNSGLEYKYIKDLNPIKLKIFINTYIKNLNKINKNSKISLYNKISNEDVNTIFRFKKYKIPFKRVNKKFKSISNINISKYPNINKIKRVTNIKYRLSKSYVFSILFVSLIIFISSCYYLFIWNDDNIKTKKINANIINSVKIEENKPSEKEFVVDDYEKYLNYSLLDVNFDSLKKQNDTTKAWIKVNGTNVNYPVVQADNNEYYLKHSFDKSYNKKGWVFLDYRNDIEKPDKNNIMYAHGLVNNMMFGSLRNVVKSSWYKNKENYVINVSTPNTKQMWQVFSTYTIEPESYYITTDFTDINFDSFINELKNRSVYNYNVDILSSDKILTLSSCYDNKKRMVLHAKLIYYENS